QVFVSHLAGKVLGSAGTLKVRGLKKEDDAVVYKYKKISRQEYEALTDVPVKQTSEAVLALAKAQLAEGNINTAKYAVASTFDATLTDRHSRALTNLQVAALAVDLDTVLLQPGNLQEHELLDHVKINPNPSLLSVVRILEEHQDGFRLNLQH